MEPSMTFSVKRKAAELVTPMTSTPREWKALSDIDDQHGLRYHMSCINLYRYNPSMSGVDPVKVIKEALARALVFYYPLAGRVREVGPSGKLIVECNAEGAHFVEADADVGLDHFEDGLGPKQTIPCMEEFICDGQSSGDIIGCPVLLVQVTRLKCGGFVFGYRFIHAVCDGAGFFQFLATIGELAQGHPTPSVAPVWARNLLTARNPPCITYDHPEYQQDSTELINTPPTEDMVHRSFFFRTKDIAILLNHLPPHLRSTTTKYEVLVASVWRSRSISLYFNDPDVPVRLLFPVNGRRGNKIPLPAGYYGIAFVLPLASTTVNELVSRPLSYVVELVQKAKKSVTEEYMRSTTDLMVLRGRPHFKVERTYTVSDITNIGVHRLNIGWGEPSDFRVISLGVGSGDHDPVSYYTRSKNSKGEDGIVVPMCLPKKAMERFVTEIDRMMKEPNIGESPMKSRM